MKLIELVFGNVAHEITGKQIMNPNAAHSIVIEALERNRSSEALAKRLWMSFVVEGREALYPEDIQEVLGAGKKAEADEAFSALDRDGNGDISLDEMILMVTEISRERKSVANSMHDVDQAIKVLDSLLSIVVFVICVFVLGKPSSPVLTAQLAHTLQSHSSTMPSLRLSQPPEPRFCHSLSSSPAPLKKSLGPVSSCS